MIDIHNPNTSFDLGCKMSEVRQKLNDAREITLPQDKSKACEVAKRAIANLKEFALEEEGFWGRLFRVILKAFGYVTEYQKILNEIAKYESEADALTDDAIFDLEKLEKSKIKTQGKIEKTIDQMDKGFEEIKGAIVTFKERCAKLKDVGQDYFDLNQEISQYQSYLKQMETHLQGLNTIYQGDTEAFEKIPTLWDKHSTAKKELLEISGKLANMISPDIQLNPVKKAKETIDVQPGGISQGGNTCYLASACQAINQVEEYRNLFNPEKNPLKQRTTESTAAFEGRKLIQRKGFFVLEKSAKGNKVDGNEINALREACFNHTIDGKKVISTLHGTFDSMEVLGRLLRVMDYKDSQLTFESQTVVDEKNYEAVPAHYFDKPKNCIVQRDPSQYSTLEEKKITKKEHGSLEFCAYPHLGEKEADGVPMQTLQKEFFSSETLSDGITVKHVSETGDITYRRYTNVQVKKTLNLDKLPNTLRILVQQLNGNRATITQPEIFWPSGRPGVGPKYQLKAIVEHMPGHYVAHLNTSKGMITANDSFVHKASSSSIPGYGYIYVKEEQET